MANDYLISSGNENSSKYFIIDELGKLELKYEGLDRTAKILICLYENDECQHLILMVRSSLLNEICCHYHITDSKVLDIETLKRLQ